MPVSADVTSDLLYLTLESLSCASCRYATSGAFTLQQLVQPQAKPVAPPIPPTVRLMHACKLACLIGMGNMVAPAPVLSPVSSFASGAPAPCFVFYTHSC